MIAHDDFERPYLYIYYHASHQHHCLILSLSQTPIACIVSQTTRGSRDSDLALISR